MRDARSYEGTGKQIEQLVILTCQIDDRKFSGSTVECCAMGICDCCLNLAT